MIGNTRIRRATNKDLPEIYRIELEVFGDDAWHPIALGFFLHLDTARFLVYDASEIIGYAIGIVEKGGFGHVLNIAVRKDYRRKRVGALLLSRLEAELKSLGAITFYLEVRADNYNAIRFYKENIYKINGVKKKYYRDGMDALVMVKELALS
ncbi:MAG: ribosomal protein S18-alanine N-acetyltransferase [Desulfurococcales archaeon]|nr:ribosomal protein S18-alanine N-acetyltransferase [Desulfurococcales archaeon]